MSYTLFNESKKQNDVHKLYFITYGLLNGNDVEMNV